jgi:hypothetical protein
MSLRDILSFEVYSQIIYTFQNVGKLNLRVTCDMNFGWCLPIVMEEEFSHSVPMFLTLASRLSPLPKG